jgi:hypothetical protein
MTSKLIITETKGDLFILAPKNSALAHCVSADFHMRKGIATTFKSLFGGVAELHAQKVTVGQVAFLTRSTRIIFYLVTKKRYWGKPTMHTLKKALIDMERVCREKGITSLSMPKIGCGLDELHWEDVYNLLEEVFKKSIVTEINIFYL